jgi:hypothetical protein
MVDSSVYESYRPLDRAIPTHGISTRRSGSYGADLSQLYQPASADPKKKNCLVLCMEYVNAEVYGKHKDLAHKDMQVCRDYIRLKQLDETYNVFTLSKETDYTIAGKWVRHLPGRFKHAFSFVNQSFFIRSLPCLVGSSTHVSKRLSIITCLVFATKHSLFILPSFPCLILPGNFCDVGVVQALRGLFGEDIRFDYICADYFRTPSSWAAQRWNSTFFQKVVPGEWRERAVLLIIQASVFTSRDATPCSVFSSVRA